MTSMSHSTPGALSGLKVVDLSRVLAGPSCTQILADHGATVIKVEPPAGDETRTWGPPFRDGTASYYYGVNRNKRNIVIDLSKPAGRDVVLRMLEDADVLTENFKVGTMERWGLGFDAVLRERFPRLVYCRISGFGADGPMGAAPGYDAVVQAMSGLMSINGDPQSGPTRIGVPMVDMATGLAATIGILMALVERAGSGRGQFVDATLFDTAVSLLHPPAANWFLSGKTPQLLGNGHPNIVPYDKFETKTVEIFLGVGNDGQFRKLCEQLGRADIADDARFARNPDRSTHRHELRELLAAELAQHDGEALCKALLDAGVPAGPVYAVPQVLTHPHTLHRQMVVEQDGYRGTGIPVKLSRTPGSVRTAPPAFGEHTQAILVEHGFSQSEIDALLAQRIVQQQRD